MATFGLAGLLLFAGSIALMKGDDTGFLLTGFGLVFLIMGVLVVRHYMLLLNQIKLNEEGIEIKGLLKNKIYRWSAVKSINLSGKEDETFMRFSTPMEAISIVTNESEKEVILVKFYSNMDRIRTVLHFVNLRLEKNADVTSDCFIHVQRKVPKFRDAPNSIKYDGNHILSFNGLMIYGSLVFALWLAFLSNSPMSPTAKAVFSSFIFTFNAGLFGYQLHYFRLNEELLIVKNHVWFWRNDVYYINDLREIVFEEPHKMSTSLRVITNNYESKLYPAGSIRNKTWSRLSAQLRKMGVPVRDEAFFDDIDSPS